ncbi:MAG: helix-turn-helix domain-containing protein, partial [Clostridia bacterium]|nr:helix-turn-helix domain-containing protein [Clostridia bacterium]
MSKFNGELIRAFADADMNISRTADTMHITCRTVMNRLDKIKQNTGLNPRRFWDLIKLLVTAEKLEKSPEAYSIIYNGYL